MGPARDGQRRRQDDAGHLVKERAAAAIIAALTLTQCSRAAPSPAHITSVRLERQGCFGSCPVDVLELRDNDFATYTGVRFTPLHGTFVAPVNFSRLAAWLETQDVRSLADRYAANTVDAPSLTLTVRDAAGVKRIEVRNTSEMPVKLDGIVASVRSAVPSDAWVARTSGGARFGAFARHDGLALETLVLGKHRAIAMGTWREVRCEAGAARSTDAQVRALSPSLLGATFYRSADGVAVRTERWIAIASDDALALTRPGRASARLQRVSLDSLRGALAAMTCR